MSAIYSFLQKRKLHESQHGYLLVFVAYILSAMMLLLGSDLFYNINSKAAGVTVDAKEETQKSINAVLYHLNYGNDTAQSAIKGIINPYGLADTAAEEKKEVKPDKVSTSGDTVWLFGNAMDGETFDSLINQVGSSSKGKTAKKTAKKTVKSMAATSTYRSSYGDITKEEMGMLERIVQAEAGGEDMKGKILVANVILNRVANKSFPDSIEGVIFQKKKSGYQFSPVGNGRYWKVKISDDTEKAVERAMKGEDYSQGALYFVARKRANSSSMRWFDQKLDRLFKHGGHEFYKNK